MTQVNPQTAEQLENAFQVFNQLSAELSQSYAGLQTQVSKLTEELNRAQDEKIAELVEKERLADQLEKLLQALPAAVLVLDHNGRIKDANPQAHEMLGNHLTNRDWQDIFLSAFVSGGDELRLKDGRWVSLSVSKLDRDSGKILLLIDISETRRMQNLLNQHQRLTALGEMSARLAHQIRTPLSTLLLYLPQVEKDMPEPGRRKELVSRMRACLRHMEQTTINMLAYARRGEEPTEPLLLDEVIASLLQTMESELLRRDAVLEVSGGEDGIRIMGNRDALLGALINLLGNALEACEGQPKLKLGVVCTGAGSVNIVLQDNGSGMSGEVLEHVFEPFFTTRSSGTGLGLAVAKAVIQGMGGAIDLSSRPGQGTRVSIRIPVLDACPVLPARMLPREIPVPGIGQDTNSKEVSVVMENLA